MVNELSTEEVKRIYENDQCKFFVVKSFNWVNVQTSINYNVWATTTKNENVFKMYYMKSPAVILFFSVNRSSKFSGYALITGKPKDSNVPPLVFVTPDGNQFRGNTFPILWLRRVDLPFDECIHLRNPLNDNKPIKIARDGQEIENSVGRTLCDIFERKIEQLYSNTISKSNCYDNQIPFVSPEIKNLSLDEEENQNDAKYFLRVNPALKVFPIDLTNMDYEDYIDAYQRSLDLWKNNNSSKQQDLVVSSTGEEPANEE